MNKIILYLFMMFVCATTGCISEDEPKGPSLSVGDPLPQFSVLMNDGEEISTSLLKGKIAVIVFFNTGCSDCQKELPVIQELWDLYKSNASVKIVAIAREETENEILRYWKENNLTMPFSPQTNRDIYNLFAPSVIPRIYIADSSGKIVVSYDDSNMPTLSSLISDIDNALLTLTDHDLQI